MVGEHARTDEDEHEPQTTSGGEVPEPTRRPPEDTNRVVGKVVGCRLPYGKFNDERRTCEDCSEEQKMECPKDRDHLKRQRELIRRTYTCPYCGTTKTNQYELTSGTWYCYDCDREFHPKGLPTKKAVGTTVERVENDQKLLKETMLQLEDTITIRKVNDLLDELNDVQEELNDIMMEGGEQ